MKRVVRPAAALLVSVLLLCGCLPAATAGMGAAAVPVPAHRPSRVVTWNKAMLAAVRNGPPRPTVIARSLFMAHQAMYDAWALYDPAATPMTLDASLRRPKRERTTANKAAAVSQAAYQTLVELFPDYEQKTQAFSTLLGELGYTALRGPEAGTPAGIGYAAAQAVLAARETDGSNAEHNYADRISAAFPELYAAVNSADPAAPKAIGGPAFDPNRWQPLRVPTGTLKDADGLPIVGDDPASYKDQFFLTPHWGAVRPFAVASGDQFRPPAPPQAGSDAPYIDGRGKRMTNDQAYQRQVDEILATSAGLTDKQKVIAEYWADGPRSETPPGHWNLLAHGISARDRHGLDEDIKLYWALNGALVDAGIAAWDAKRAYDFVRPVSAIRHKYAGQMVRAWGGPNRGAQWIPGEAWQPYQDPAFVTPPFSEYVSGHSTYSTAAAAVLTAFTGSARFYDGKTTLPNADGAPTLLGQHVMEAGANRFEQSPSADVTLRWRTFQEAAAEAGLSRRYGGIHFQDGDLRGREMGRRIGAQAFRLAERYWTGKGAAGAEG